jgi:6-pyruvoyltetrahydropterin/6-carboxytetrahydropterin synthase
LYILQAETHFDAAHHLVGYKGKCSNLHGHRWRVVLKVQAEKVNEIGIAIDFKDLKSCLEEAGDAFDHQNINEIPPFDKINPTAENLSEFFYNQIDKKLSGGVKIKEVTVWESDTCSVTYCR